MRILAIAFALYSLATMKSHARYVWCSAPQDLLSEFYRKQYFFGLYLNYEIRTARFRLVVAVPFLYPKPASGIPLFLRSSEQRFARSFVQITNQDIFGLDRGALLLDLSDTFHLDKYDAVHQDLFVSFLAERNGETNVSTLHFAADRENSYSGGSFGGELKCAPGSSSAGPAILLVTGG